MAKKTDFNKKSEKELLKFIAKAKATLRDLRFKQLGTKLSNTKEIKELKKDIARAFTALNNKK